MENEIGSTWPFAANKNFHRPHTMLLVTSIHAFRYKPNQTVSRYRIPCWKASSISSQASQRISTHDGQSLLAFPSRAACIACSTNFRT